MSEPSYVSRVSVDRPGGPLRWAHLPAEAEPVAFGVHGEVAEHYQAREGSYEPHATTLDYVVAAAAG
jgi:hypothetical protein